MCYNLYNNIFYMFSFSYTKKNKKNYSQKGFTLLEGMIAVAIFLTVSVGIYQTYIGVIELIKVSRTQITTAALANEQFEIIRNMPYSDIGILGGLPAGKLQKEKIVTRNNDYKIITTIRNIDDPFDGVIGGSPNDTSPADYKLVALDIVCLNCKFFKETSFTTYVGPRALEITSTNGALFIQVFNASGQPIQGADVHIVNTKGTSTITIDDVTNNAGFLQIVDTPPGAEAYEITVSKPGYSTERTYPTGDASNPNPKKTHSTVIAQQLTQVSFSIDKTSTLNIASVNKTCATINNVDFAITSSKLIGTTPDIHKYDEYLVTDNSGEKNITTLEWGTYNIKIVDIMFDLIGTIPLFPITLNPNMTQDLKIIVASKQPESLLVTVRDIATGLPLSGAEIELDGAGYNEKYITGRGFLNQTDWSGGSGQDNFIDETKYDTSDGKIEINNPAGELQLKKLVSDYETSGNLISSSFDTGSIANFHQLLWQPENQPIAAGTSSAKFQIATNNDNTTWEFYGPDGSTTTYYTLSGENINIMHNGDRYFKYKTFLSTASTSVTSLIADVQFTFTSECVPPGQIIFNNLSSGDYTLTASRTSYQSFTNTVTMSTSSKQYEIILGP